MGSSLRITAAALWVLLLTRAAAADPIIYDNGGPIGTHGVAITQTYSADDFRLVGTSTIDHIRFWTLVNRSQPISAVRNGFTWAIFQDAGAIPGAMLSSGNATGVSTFRTSPPPLNNNSPLYHSYEWSLPIPPVTLEAGIYWLMLHNGPGFAPTPGQVVFWEASALEPVVPMRIGANFAGATFPPFSSLPLDLAFQLSGDTLEPVPEPASMILVATGLLGAALRRFRRSQP